MPKKSLVIEGMKPQHRRFCELVAHSMEPKAAAKAAGFNANYAPHLMKRQDVQDYLHDLYLEIQRKTHYTRQRAVELAMDAFEMAKLMADPATMVKALNELNKIHGYHEPDRVKIELSDDAAKAMAAMERLDDQKLLEIAAIDADFEEVQH